MDIEDQPDFEQLQQSVKVFSAQLAKLPNIPILNLAARLDAMQENTLEFRV